MRNRRAWPAIRSPDELDDLFKRRAREEDFINSVPLEQPGIRLGDRAAAAAEHTNIAGARLTQLLQHFAEELYMPTVIRGDADRLHVLLDGGPDNIAYGTMITQVNDFDAMAGELQVDGNDRAVMAIANRHDRKDARSFASSARPGS